MTKHVCPIGSYNFSDGAFKQTHTARYGTQAWTPRDPVISCSWTQWMKKNPNSRNRNLSKLLQMDPKRKKTWRHVHHVPNPGLDILNASKIIHLDRVIEPHTHTQRYHFHTAKGFKASGWNTTTWHGPKKSTVVFQKVEYRNTTYQPSLVQVFLGVLQPYICIHHL